MNAARIAVLTSGRADYGHLYWLLRAIEADDAMELLLYVTGSHLSVAHGATVAHIEADGFPIRRRVEILLAADTPTAAGKAMALALAGFGDALAEDHPDVLVLLGDRFEIVPVALAAVLQQVPIAHLHGGEVTSGALDESFRHAITKLATLHFPATEAYRRRILQMGEPAERVHDLGAPGLDHVHRTELLSRTDLEAALGLSLVVPTALVTYHPVTTEPGRAAEQIEALLAALVAEAPLQAVFTRANADPEGRVIDEHLESFCAVHPDRFRLVDDLGTVPYLSCLRHLDLMVGSSSSGLVEAPSFARPVVNVGKRQDGRVMAANVIQVGNDEADVRSGIRRALSVPFGEGLRGMVNPYDRYGDGRVSHRIADALASFVCERAPVGKRFVDREFASTAGAARDRSPDDAVA